MTSPVTLVTIRFPDPLDPSRNIVAYGYSPDPERAIQEARSMYLVMKELAAIPIPPYLTSPESMSPSPAPQTPAPGTQGTGGTEYEAFSDNVYWGLLDSTRGLYKPLPSGHEILKCDTCERYWHGLPVYDKRPCFMPDCGGTLDMRSDLTALARRTGRLYL